MSVCEHEVRRTLLFELPREDFATAIDDIARHWQKSLDIRGGFVEKENADEEMME